MYWRKLQAHVIAHVKIVKVGIHAGIDDLQQVEHTGYDPAELGVAPVIVATLLQLCEVGIVFYHPLMTGKGGCVVGINNIVGCAKIFARQGL